MTGLVWIPAQAEAFLGVTVEFGLGIDSASRHAGMFRSIEDQRSPIRGHCGNDVRILRLISGFVDLLRMIDFLDDVELDLHPVRLLRCASPEAPDFLPIFVVICSVWRHGLG